MRQAATAEAKTSLKLLVENVTLKQCRKANPRVGSLFTNEFYGPHPHPLKRPATDAGLRGSRLLQGAIPQTVKVSCLLPEGKWLKEINKNQKEPHSISVC